MDVRIAERIESAVDAGAAALLAVAVAYVLHTLLVAQTGAAAAAGASAFGLCFVGLRRIPPVAVSLAAEPVATPVAQLLAEADRSLCEIQEKDVLILDDILTALGSESRVVQLFDPRAIPTPQSVNTRIESHLDLRPNGGPVDDSQALYDALRELRRSLN